MHSSVGGRNFCRTFQLLQGRGNRIFHRKFSVDDYSAQDQKRQDKRTLLLFKEIDGIIRLN